MCIMFRSVCVFMFRSVCVCLCLGVCVYVKVGLACCDSWGRKGSDTTERLD